MTDSGAHAGTLGALLRAPLVGAAASRCGGLLQLYAELQLGAPQTPLVTHK